MSLPSPLYGLVIEHEKRLSKNGKPYWVVSLRTKSGNVKAYIWNAPSGAEVDPRFPYTGDLIEVTDLVDQMAERSSIIINMFLRKTKESLPDDHKSIVEFEKATDEDIQYALDLIADSSFWDDSNHHRFVMGCLSKLDKEKLRSCPAATKIHHPYHGGLIIHTAEVLELCKSIVECSRRYTFINKDVLYASAILHDIGKVETYSINEIGAAQSKVTEQIIGHLFYSMHLVQVAIDKKQIDPEFGNEVLHCIASHHGLPEYGSLKVVQSIEAGILSRADYLSSRNGIIEKVLKESIKTGQHLQESFQVYGDTYFYSTGMKHYTGDTKCHQA